MKLAVYDSMNPDRHLGDLEYNGPTTEGRYHRLPVLTPVTRRSIFEAPSATMHSHSVEVQVNTRTSTKTTQVTPTVREKVTLYRTVLTTSDDLKKLMLLREFTLPGETTQTARYRRDWTRHHPDADDEYLRQTDEAARRRQQQRVASFPSGDY